MTVLSVVELPRIDRDGPVRMHALQSLSCIAACNAFTDVKT